MRETFKSTNDASGSRRGHEDFVAHVVMLRDAYVPTFHTVGGGGQVHRFVGAS